MLKARKQSFSLFSFDIPVYTETDSERKERNYDKIFGLCFKVFSKYIYNMYLLIILSIFHDYEKLYPKFRFSTRVL